MTSQIQNQAAPLRYDQLTEQQQNQLNDIKSWLEAYAETDTKIEFDLPRKLGRISLHQPNLIRKRPSNILLIDGGRGAGKTTLALTLLDLLNSDSKFAKSHHPQDWLNLSEFYLPLTPFDLQPLPPDTNLITWIGMRLLSIVEDIYGGYYTEQDPASQAHWLDATQFPEKIENSWRELLLAIARGWDGTAGTNKGHVDPDWHVYTLGRAASSKLDLKYRWQEFVNSITQEVIQKLRLSEKTRLLIVIDDADLNPHHCTSILSVLHQIWHPQLCFILAGDTELFEHMFASKFLSSMQSHPRQDPPGQPPNSIQIKARDMALQILSKTIPSSHRFKLNEASPKERLDLLKKLSTTENKHLTQALDDYIKPLNIGTILSGNLRKLVNQHNTLINTLSKQNNITHGIWLALTGFWKDVIDEAQISFQDQQTLLDIFQAPNTSDPSSIYLNQHGTFVTESYHKKIAVRFNNNYIWTGETIKFLFRGDFGTLSNKDNERILDTLQILLEFGVTHINKAEDFGISRASQIPIIGTDINIMGERVSILWPTPNFPTHGSFLEVRNNFKNQLDTLIPTNPVLDGITAVNGALPLNILISSTLLEFSRLANINTPNPEFTQKTSKISNHLKEDPEEEKWDYIFTNLTNIIPHAPLHLQNVLHQWVFYQLVLISSPEFGLPISMANKIFSSWQAVAFTPNNIHGVRDTTIDAVKFNRLNAFIPRINPDPNLHNKLTQQIDKENQDYLFSIIIGGAAPEYTTFLIDTLGGFSLKTAPYQSKSRDLRTLIYASGLDQLILQNPTKCMLALQSIKNITTGKGGTSVALQKLWDVAVTPPYQDNTSKKLTNELNSLVSFIGTNIETTLLEKRFWSNHNDYKFLAPSSPQTGGKTSSEKLFRSLGGPAANIRWLCPHATRIPQNFLQMSEHIQLGFTSCERPMPNNKIPPFTWAILMLIRDYIIDTEDKEITTAFEPHKCHPFEAIGTVIKVHETVRTYLPWIMPNWLTYRDESIILQTWQTLIKFTQKSNTKLEHQSSEGLLYSFISIIKDLGYGLITNIGKNLDLELSHQDWQDLGMSFDKWKDPDDLSHRHQAMRFWTIYGAPIFASSEYGLPRNKAEAFLKGWAESLTIKDIKESPDTLVDNILTLRDELIHHATKTTSQNFTNDILQRFDKNFPRSDFKNILLNSLNNTNNQTT